MAAIRAEFLKLKRSLSWAVVILLPIILVISGVVMTLVDGEQLDNGWYTLWLRSVVFYGLFPLAVGIGILASLVWRVEHRGGNWNALMSGPTPSLEIVASKATVVAVLAAAMQVIFIIAVIVLGKFVFKLPGMLPGECFLASGLIVLASIPVAALQSGLSMILRSFAAPIAIGFLGAGTSAALLVVVKTHAVVFFSPYALLSRATQLGTSVFADSGQITVGAVLPMIIAAVFFAAVFILGTAAILDRRDVLA